MQITPFADLLDALFKTHLRSDGREYSYLEVTRAIKAQFGETISPSYLGKVRSGAIQNPGYATILLLCAFFQVPASYFFPDLDPLQQTDTPGQQREQFRAALRRIGLAPEVQVYLEGLVEALRQRAPESPTPTS
jgi:transcriptional regulator with XRE-family HTH domain